MFVIIEKEKCLDDPDSRCDVMVLRTAEDEEHARKWIEEHAESYKLEGVNWTWNRAGRRYRTYDRYGDWYCLEILDVESV